MSCILALESTLAAAGELSALTGLPAVAAALEGPYSADGYTAALTEWIAARGPAYVLFEHNYEARDYAPKLAARHARPLLAGVIAMRKEGEQIVFTRPVFQGRLNAGVAVAAPPVFVSVQKGAFQSAPAAPAESVRLTAAAGRVTAGPPFRAAGEQVDLSAARRIVAVGRGIRDEAGVALARELAVVLDAELAGSRPICDNGWLPMERQVGSSGQTVAPALYFALGISGAIQHVMGMQESKTIVAINKDSDAPIFETAHYGIASDLFEVVPALIAALKKDKE